MCDVGGGGLGFLKRKLREWNKSSFDNMRANKDRLFIELQQVDYLMEVEENRLKELNCKRK